MCALRQPPDDVFMPFVSFRNRWGCIGAIAKVIDNQCTYEDETHQKYVVTRGNAVDREGLEPPTPAL